MIAIEIGTMELLREGAGTAMPCNKEKLYKEIPVTALITLTAGVNRPSAMTALAPNNVHTRSPILTTLISLIHAPLTGRPVKSEVESIVSVTVSKSESPCCTVRVGVC